MSTANKRILEMLLDGKIAKEEAERLLDGLAGAKPDEPRRVSARDEKTAPAEEVRFLRIAIDSPENEQFTMRVPVALLRAGLNLLDNHSTGVEPADLPAPGSREGQHLWKLLRHLDVDIDCADKSKVRIFCE